MRGAGVVLCGGRSSRMGRAKAWLPWLGRPMIEHVVLQLAEVVEEIVVVTSEALGLPDLPARIVTDTEAERGPLAGIRDGLAAVESEFAFVTGTDAPYLTSAFVSQMLSLGKACAPRSEGHVQVLCAVYPSAASKEAARLLDSGSGRPLHLLEAIGYEGIDFDPKDETPPWRGFNTPEAYLAGLREQDPAATVEIELAGRAAQTSPVTRRVVPAGTLGEILGNWPDATELVEGDSLAPDWIASLGGREAVRDLKIPVGPGDSVRIVEASEAAGQGRQP